jgi:hypothetical protein
MRVAAIYGLMELLAPADPDSRSRSRRLSTTAL